MSGPANQLLRQLGLLLFLAEVGTSAGVNLVQTFMDSGLTLFGVGFAITLLPMIVALLVGYYGFPDQYFGSDGNDHGRNDKYTGIGCR